MKTLLQYEEELTNELLSVILIGQLDYDEDDLAALRNAFQALFTRGVPSALRDVEARHQRAFALYLALEGIYSYESGNYWDGPDSALNLATPQHKSKVGELFRRAVRAAQLPSFENFSGHVNVMPILAHGGIPNHCLTTFFDLLEGAHSRETSVDVPTLLDEWKVDGFPPGIHKPVQRFLLYGGKVAEEFVERCLELWEDELDRYSLDLPERVFNEYEAWQRTHVRRRGQRMVRFGRPKLVYAPYGEGVAINLPPVIYQAGHAPAQLGWRIEAGDRYHEVATRRRAGANEVRFEAREVVNVVTVASKYTVTLSADGQRLKAWTLPGPGAPPLLVFDGITGELIPDRQESNTKEYWFDPGERHLVYPRGSEPIPQGARKLAELPNPEGEWDRFVFETWELEPDGRLDLRMPDGQEVAFCARNVSPPARPFLYDRPVFGPAELYNGRPPMLCIPPGRTDHDPAKWRITIEPISAADPHDRRVVSLADLPRHCVMVEDSVLLALDAPGLLGSSPIGEFNIRLRGPYGRRAEFHLRFAPGLEFEGYPQPYLDADERPTTFRIKHRADLELTCEESGVMLGPPEPDGPLVARSVTVEADLKQVPLLLAGERGECSFDLPIYRLRIGLVEPERPDEFHWSTTPLRIHPKALANPQSALFRVELPLLPDQKLFTHWRLLDHEGRMVRETSSRQSPRHPQTGLAEWLDTFRANGSVTSLQVVVRDQEAGGAETVVTIAYLLPTLELGQVDTEWRIGSGANYVSIAWKADVPISGCWLRLWPVDRPWVGKPDQLRLPNEATDYAEWKLSLDSLRPGEYLAEMVVIDPWVANVPTRPTPGAPNTFWLRPDDMDAVLEDALTQAGRGELLPSDALAWLGYIARAASDVGPARFNLILKRYSNELPLDQLLFWAEITRRADDSVGYAIAQEALFAESRLAKFDGVSEEQRTACLAHLPPGLDANIYRALLPHASGDVRRLCLTELCRAGDEAAFDVLLSDFRDELIDGKVAAKMLIPSAKAAADYLYERGDEKAKELLRALLVRTVDERYIAAGYELETNVGRIRVTGVRKPDRTRLELCRADDLYQLIGELWPDDSKWPISIDLTSRSINFLKKPVYKCAIEGCDYVFADVKALQRHYKSRSGHSLFRPYLTEVLKIHPFPLTKIAVLPPKID